MTGFRPSLRSLEALRGAPATERALGGRLRAIDALVVKIEERPQERTSGALVP